MLLDTSREITTTRPDDAAASQDVATLRLICLVRAGDGYVIRAVARLAEPARPRRQVDISFGDTADGGRRAELDSAVRSIERWCDDGTAVALSEVAGRLTLRADDGTAVVLPRD